MGKASSKAEMRVKENKKTVTISKDGEEWGQYRMRKVESGANKLLEAEK